jgi:RNA polymerase sigma-70 factor (ECF subfamily)
VQRELVEAAQRGDHRAFETLATAAADRLYAIARLLLRDSDQAQDAVQEALVRAWRDLPALRDPERFDGWLYRILVNACNELRRRRRRWSSQIRLLRSEPQVEDGSGFVADRDQLERGFLRLNHDQRTVVVLHFFLGMPIQEVASTLGIPVGTARSRLRYGMDGMRAALEADARVVSAEGRTA